MGLHLHKDREVGEAKEQRIVTAFQTARAVTIRGRVKCLRLAADSRRQNVPTPRGCCGPVRNLALRTQLLATATSAPRVRLRKWPTISQERAPSTLDHSVWRLGVILRFSAAPQVGDVGLG